MCVCGRPKYIKTWLWWLRCLGQHNLNTAAKSFSPNIHQHVSLLKPKRFPSVEPHNKDNTTFSKMLTAVLTGHVGDALQGRFTDAKQEVLAVLRRVLTMSDEGAEWRTRGGTEWLQQRQNDFNSPRDPSFPCWIILHKRVCVIVAFKWSSDGEITSRCYRVS